METAESKTQQQRPREQTIAELISAQKKSGMSIAAFARERGVPAWELYQATRPKRKRRAAKRRVDFVEVAVSPKAPADAPLELVLPGDLRVRVPPGFDELTLRRIVGALASC